MSKGLLTTSVGSFAKPPYLAKARTDFAAGKVSAQELDKLTRQATKEIIELQQELGIDILVHGEMERGDMVAYFAEHFPGMATGGLVRSYGNRYYHKPKITGELRWEKPVTVDLWKYAQSLTDRPVKGMLTGPYTIVEWSFDEHYPDRRAAVMAMAEVVRREAMALEEAGAKYVQIDEPAVSTRLEDLPLAIEAMAVVTEGLKAETITHMCYGDFAPAYDNLVKMPVDQLDLEMANSDYDLIDVMKRKPLPDDKSIGLGVLDVHNHRVETVDEVVEGINKALEVLPPERIYVDPDCGLKTRTWDEAAAKLKVMVEAVKRVKAEHGID
jgi:5-methyltetrahydropteroyltriglutamate--homocysteine methyltransferase